MKINLATIYYDHASQYDRDEDDKMLIHQVIEAIQQAFDMAFNNDPSCVGIELDWTGFEHQQHAHDVAMYLPLFSQEEVTRKAFYQWPAAWHKHVPSSAFPYCEVQTDTRYPVHPQRPPMPKGTVYSRYDTTIEKTVSFRVIDQEKDLERFTRWMNDPRVAEFWEQAWSEEKLKECLQSRLDDAHIIPLIGEFDGQPFGYVEAYWVAEDRLSPYYQVDSFDRGIHLLVGETAFRGPHFFNAWMKGLTHYLFCDENRTQRIVLEPRADNQRLFTRLQDVGYSKCFEFNFPHKRSALWMLHRQSFFKEQGSC
ncbi:acetyltransferase [Vibrio sp.]|nr:acetyltransferase [Vibrio sp.]